MAEASRATPRDTAPGREETALLFWARFVTLWAMTLFGKGHHQADRGGHKVGVTSAHVGLPTCSFIEDFDRRSGILTIVCCAWKFRRTIRAGRSAVLSGSSYIMRESFGC